MKDEDLRLRIRKLCAEAILRKVVTKQEALELAQAQPSGVSVSKLKANVELLTSLVGKPELMVREAAFLANSWDVALKDNVAAETTLDKIIRSLKPDAWSGNLLLLITPIADDSDRYRLYLLDRSRRGNFLGAATISNDVLSDLHCSQALHHCCVVFSSDYVKLDSSNQKAAFVLNLLNTLGGGLSQNENRLVATQQSQSMVPYQVEAELETSRSVVIEEVPEIGQTNVVAIMNRINQAPTPNIRDLHKFFDLAEYYEFKIYIRPELCWKRFLKIANETPKPQIRFHVETFMIFDNYLGSISVNLEQLEMILAYHPRLLQRIKVITDVLEITPMPKLLMKCIRTLSGWFGMELPYDAFAEVLFHLYKNYIRT